MNILGYIFKTISKIFSILSLAILFFNTPYISYTNPVYAHIRHANTLDKTNILNISNNYNTTNKSNVSHALDIHFDDNKALSLNNDLNTKFKNIDGRLYYFKNGQLQYGMTNIDGNIYYLHPKKGYLLNGLQSIGDKIYYFDQNTYKIKKNSSIVISNLSFNFDENGICTSIKPTSDDKRTKLLEYAFKQIGTPYGSNDGKFRCNTFASNAYESIGINYLKGKKSYEQAKICLNLGCNIKLENLKPGDLIFFNNYQCKEGPNCPRIDGIYHIHHVAIYVAPGIIIESTSSNINGFPGVKVTNFEPNRPKLNRCPILYADLIDGVSKKTPTQ